MTRGSVIGRQRPPGETARTNIRAFGRFRSFVLAVVFSLATTGSTEAAEASGIAKDRLTVIDSGQPPWPAVGRLNFAGYRHKTMCTGTLISANVVVTAAHCLFNPQTGRRIRTEDLRFVAGVRRDQKAGLFLVDCVRTPAPFRFQKTPSLDNLAADIALVRLTTHAGIPPVSPIVVAANEAGQLMAAGYRQSRRFLPTLDTACRVSGKAHGAWVTDCNVESGSSGGPVFIQKEGKLRLTAVVSARAADGRSVVVPWAAAQTILDQRTCEETR